MKARMSFISTCHIFACTVFFVMFTGGCGPEGSSTVLQQPPLYPLQFEDSVIDAGEHDVSKTPDIEVPITFKNISSQPVEIKNINTGCQCVVLDADALRGTVIAPGETRQLTFKWHLGKTAGPQEQAISFELQNVDKRHTIKIVADIDAPPELLSDKLVLSRNKVGQFTGEIVIRRNRKITQPRLTLDMNASELLDLSCTTSLRSVVGAGDDTVTDIVTVRFFTTLRENFIGEKLLGNLEFRWQNYQGGNRIPCKLISRHPVSTETESVFMGISPVGETLRKTIDLKSETGNYKISVVRLEPRLNGTTINVTAENDILIEHHVVEVGRFEFEIHVEFENDYPPLKLVAAGAGVANND